MNRKGVGLLGMLAILFVIFMGIFFLFKSGEFFANSIGTEKYEMSKWSGNEFMFESDLHFLENSLWITAENLAYENGRNGTIFDEPWDMVSDMVCWNCKKGIPPEDLVADQLFKRVNQTYEKYFDKISISIENHTNLNMTYNNNFVKLFYKGNFSYHPSVDYYTNASNLWVNATTPLRYFLLYDKAKE
ncbi:MAG: hypothetical protein J7L45_00375, partial [Candidatus Aenigmarchaeota archaeon]|nr:hypothetical protein [Candidatus Aenigmarchaeota archaeon]